MLSSVSKPWEKRCFYLRISVLMRHLELCGDDELWREVEVGLLVSGLHEVVLGDDPGPSPGPVLRLTQSPQDRGDRVLQAFRASLWSSRHKSQQSYRVKTSIIEWNEMISLLIILIKFKFPD